MSVEQEILKESHVVAVVGISDKEERASNHVAQYLQMNGYRIIPVNPMLKEIFGETCYPDLLTIPEKIDVVDIFRRAEDVPAIVEEAIKIGAKAVWMQEGITHEAAAARARNAGLKVVMNRCMFKEHMRLSLGSLL